MTVTPVGPNKNGIKEYYVGSHKREDFTIIPESMLTKEMTDALEKWFLEKYHSLPKYLQKKITVQLK